MSVAQLTAQEFGCFVAICHKHLDAGPLDKLCQLAFCASMGNVGAFSAQYGEPIEPCTIEDIEAIALDYLAERRDMVADHFGPLAYNMIANNGTAFVAPGIETNQSDNLFKALDSLEKLAKKWQEAEYGKLKRAEQDAASYDDIGQLATLSKAGILAKMEAAGADRIIFATYHVDESDLQTDYFGGRSTRRVVIGFGKGKRENFRQLRKAAGQFPPTAHMGPGLDIFKIRVMFTNSVNSNGCYYGENHYSHWHDDVGNGAEFSTQAEADAFVAEQTKKGEPHDIGFGGQTGHFRYRVERGSYENRENYSMGGGNYLGTSRYSGWKVSSSEYCPDSCEYWKAQ